jgi:hypothetical protein
LERYIYILVVRRQRFGETHCCHLQGWSSDAGKLKDFATSTLKTEAICLSETLSSTDETTRHQKLEEHNHHSQSHEISNLTWWFIIYACYC